MFWFPYGTDAPVYHLPFATGGIILANVFVYFVLQLPHPDGMSFLALHLGSLNPIEWVTSSYLHGNFLHLMGNMVFLWVFGLIVEGKIGSTRFLIVYHLIMIFSNSITQALTLFLPFAFSAYSLGASDAISGIMMVAVCWAPVNSVRVLFFFIVYPFRFESTVGFVAGYLFAWDFVVVLASGHIFSGSFAHLLGACGGFAIGLFMLRKGMVDCEGYDLISVWKGEAGSVDSSETQIALDRDRINKRAAQLQSECADGLSRVREYLEQGHFEMAVRRFNAIRANGSRTLRWPRDLLLAAIRGLIRTEHWELVMPLMEEYVRKETREKEAVQLQLARILLVKLERPSDALVVLDEIDLDSLNAKHLRVYQMLRHAVHERLMHGFQARSER